MGIDVASQSFWGCELLRALRAVISFLSLIYALDNILWALHGRFIVTFVFQSHG